MPEQTVATRILRDDVLAQLRAARHPMSTTELRLHAPKVPIAGVRTPVAPIQEQIYRVLCGLHQDGLITRGRNRGRGVCWSATASTADEEIAALEAALTSPCADTVQDNTAAVTTALSRVIASWADLLTAVSRHPERAVNDDLIAAAIRTAETMPTAAAEPPGPDQR